MLKRKLLLALIYICSLIYLCTCAYARIEKKQVLEILMPEVQVEDFVYRPTPEGYNYSYILKNGKKHEEIAYIVDPKSPEAAAYIQSEAARRAMPRPKGTKNRKLSPKSLQSLAG